MAGSVGGISGRRGILSLLGRCGERLPATLTGETGFLETLFPGGSTLPLERLYEDAPAFRHHNMAAVAALRELQRQAPIGRGFAFSSWVAVRAALRRI